MDEASEISLRFGGDHEGSELSLIGILFLAAMLIFLFRCSHRNFLVAFLVLSFFSSLGQRIAVAGINIHVFRLVILFAWLSLALRSRLRRLTFTSQDKLFICWVCANAVSFVLLYTNSQAVMNRIGFAFTALGSYFLFRQLVSDWDKMENVFRSLTLLIVIVGVFMMIEFLSGKNVLHVLGGVPEEVTVRDGRLRCQGPFAHPILAGTLGATLLPFAFAAYQQKLCTLKLALLGLLGCFIVTFTASSSGPAIAFVGAAAALFLWAQRHWLKQARWIIACGLLSLHVIMKAPVWALIARVKVFGGSTSWHRFQLFDDFVNHFSDWWLVGVQTTSDWGHYTWDTINAFVEAGVRGGLLTLALFLLVIYSGFRVVGLYLQEPEMPVEYQRMMWAMGCALFAHVISFWGIVYFDQSVVGWYLLLALFASAAELTTDLRRSHGESGESAQVDLESAS